MNALRRFLRKLWFLGRVRVKYSLILLFGTIPLLYVTCISMVSPVPPRPPVAIDELKARVDAAVASSEALREESEPPLKALADLALRPYDEDCYRRISRIRSHERTEPLLAEVEPVSALRDIVEVAAKIPPDDPGEMNSEELDTTRQAVAGLQGAIGKAKKKDGLGGLGGESDGDGESLEAIVKDWLEAIDGRICLNDALKAFENEDYDGCLKLLKEREWGALKAEAAQSETRAEFRKQGEEYVRLVAELLSGTADRTWADRIAAIEKFLEGFSTAPHDDDEALHAQLCKDLERLKANYAIHDVDRLPLPERIRKLREVVCRFPKAELEADAKEKLIAWLQEGIPEKEKPDVDSEIKEAEGRNGALYIGIFELSGDYYKHWKDKKDRETNRGGYRTIIPEDLKRQPGPLTPVTCVISYGNYRQALVRNLQSLAGWQQFTKDCKSEQDKLDEYAAKGGDVMSVSFRDVVNFAEDAISVWGEHVEPLLSMAPCRGRP